MGADVYLGLEGNEKGDIQLSTGEVEGCRECPLAELSQGVRALGPAVLLTHCGLLPCGGQAQLLEA